MTRRVSAAILLAVMFCSQGGGQNPNTGPNIKGSLSFATNEYFAKGGIGIITSDLYIDLKSANNELRLGGGQRWTGRSTTMPEVVIVFRKKVLSPGSLPHDFDISQAILVSFEDVRVRFFNFPRMSGGYYRRTGKE